jgi:transcriptional regulator with XRE-family HTH domain
MYGKTLFVILSILGIRQIDVAARLGTSRVNVHRWASGKRRVPEDYLTPLLALVDEGIAQRHTTVTNGSLSRKDSRNLPKIPALLRQLLEDQRPTAGRSLTNCIKDGLERLEPFRTMTPTELCQPAHSKEFARLAAELHHFGQMLRTLGPLVHYLVENDEDAAVITTALRHAFVDEEESSHACNDDQPDEFGASGTTNASGQPTNAGPLDGQQP